MNTRTKVLAGVLAILVVIVAANFLLASGAEGSTDDQALSARKRYLDEARLVAQKRGLIEHEDQYRAALEQTRARWDRIRRALVTAPSAGLAEAQFRDEVLEYVRRRQIEGATTGKIESSAIGDEKRLRRVQLQLEFTTRSTREVYELIDDLEHMRDLTTHVASLEITGPGRIPKGAPHVSVSVVLESIAYIEGEG